jgi:F420-dependent oxidoreductase-like protein
MDFRIMIEPQQGASYDDQLAVARTAEDCGFDGFFRSDHFLVMGDRDGLPGPTDAWVTLGALARETTRIRLGSMVSSATFRLPAHLAIQVAQVDAMSDGRIELGLGTGWFEDEHAAYGFPFPAVGERFDRLEEQLEIVTGLWATPPGGRFDYAGRHYQLTGSPALPKPMQQPRPPIIIGGGGPRRTPALAARFADEFNVPFRSVEETGTQLGRVRAACVSAGRDPDELVYSAAAAVCCGRDQAAVDRRAAAIGRDVAELRADGVAGTPDEVRAAVQRFAVLGVTRLYLQVLDLSDLDHIGLLADTLLAQPPGKMS